MSALSVGETDRVNSTIIEYASPLDVERNDLYDWTLHNDAMSVVIMIW